MISKINDYSTFEDNGKYTLITLNEDFTTINRVESYDLQFIINEALKYLKFIEDTLGHEYKSLFEYLDHYNFKDNLASTKFHGNFKGGLMIHSLNVASMTLVNMKKFINAKLINPDLFQDMVKKSLLIGLAHDICKIGVYEKFVKNVKDEGTGKWFPVECFKYVENLPLGHGSKSAHILSQLVPGVIDNDVIMAIQWHMGYTDISTHFFMSAGGSYSNARKNPYVEAVTMADSYAAILDVTVDYVEIGRVKMLNELKAHNHTKRG